MQINLITGISGSGKSVALRAFEDAGYDCVDNLPVTLLENLITTLVSENSESVAVAIDARRGKSISELPKILENLRRNHQVRIRSVFVIQKPKHKFGIIIHFLNNKLRKKRMVHHKRNITASKLSDFVKNTFIGTKNEIDLRG